jgi:uncharacterized protein YukE
MSEKTIGDIMSELIEALDQLNLTINKINNDLRDINNMVNNENKPDDLFKTLGDIFKP